MILITISLYKASHGPQIGFSVLPIYACTLLSVLSTSWHLHLLLTVRSPPALDLQLLEGRSCVLSITILARRRHSVGFRDVDSVPPTDAGLCFSSTAYQVKFWTTYLGCISLGLIMNKISEDHNSSSSIEFCRWDNRGEAQYLEHRRIWMTWLYSWNQHNIVNQLYSDIK